MNKLDEFLWTEAYRPQTIDDCILTKDVKDTLNGIVKSGEIQNMLFCGTAGTGKTTAAKALCKILNLDYMFINASEDNGIDVLRNKIRQFASSVSLGSPYKVVILDEADGLHPTSIQPALRAFIEEFSNNCRFILTCNIKNKIISPLHSRLSVIEFNSSKKALANLAADFMKRMKRILANENVSYDEKVLAEIIMLHAPDWRRIIGECQRYSVSGTLSPLAIVNQSDENFHQLVSYLKEKNFKNMRIWVANNSSVDSSSIFKRLYDTMNSTMKPESIPQAVLILADYSYKSAFVADKELNLVAALVELMGSVQWK